MCMRRMYSLRQKEPVAYGGDRDQADLCVLFAGL